MSSLRFIVRGFIKRHAITITSVLSLVLVFSNWLIYASMKAEVMSVQWKYDQYEMHVDSVFEMYNVNKSYSRIVKFDE